MARPRLYLRGYRPGDLDRFTPREDFIAERDAVDWAWGEGPPPGRAWTLLDAASPQSVFGTPVILGIGGIFDGGDGIWQAWAILSTLTPREWCVAGELAELAIQGVERFNRPKAIVADARTSIPGAVAVLEKLGFQSVRQVRYPQAMGEVVYEQMARAV